MKTYQPLECGNVEEISAGIYKFLAETTDLLTTNAIGWHFLNHKELLAAVPELVKFFFNHKLIPKSASVVILEETGQLPLHVDELPVVAKVNFPVINTAGWTTRWYSVSDDDLNKCPKVTNQFGSQIEDLSLLPPSAFTFHSESKDLDSPIVFNSRIPHEVVKIDGNSPRIIASFTFANEPLELLK